MENIGTTDQITAYLKSFDMLIIGFYDCYDAVGSKSAPAIVSYISSGKSTPVYP